MPRESTSSREGPAQSPSLYTSPAVRRAANSTWRYQIIPYSGDPSPLIRLTMNLVASEERANARE
jgi:hypothetical protein